MAAIENRSRYTVSVKRRPDLAKVFPHDRKARALEYLDTLLDEALRGRPRTGRGQPVGADSPARAQATELPRDEL